MVPLDFRDVPFARLPVWSAGSSGTPFLRWVPFGMPQLGRYKWILDMVFFLYASEEDALIGRAYGGTGFLVSVPSKRWPDQYHHHHGVTNWHVACDGGFSVIRVNGLSGKPEAFSFGPEDWIFRPRNHDIAISPPLLLRTDTHKIETAGASVLLTTEDEVSQDINAAEDVFMVGRFVDYDGVETNVPSFRFGHISIINAKIKQPTGYLGRSIVVDMHSRTGYSGSPVFVYRTAGSRFIEGGAGPEARFVMGGHYLKILGIHWGQFPEQWEIRSGAVKAGTNKSASLITDGHYVEGLSGMTCVAPSSAILDILYGPELTQMREAMEVQLEPIFNKWDGSPKPE